MDRTMCEWIHQLAEAKGFWEDERSDGELIALIHSELSELLEALRGGNPSSEKIPDFSSAEEEAADVVIRLMDMAGARDWDLEGAVYAKCAHNMTRPYKHGKKF